MFDGIIMIISQSVTANLTYVLQNYGSKLLKKSENISNYYCQNNFSNIFHLTIFRIVDNVYWHDKSSK